MTFGRSLSPSASMTYQTWKRCPKFASGSSGISIFSAIMGSPLLNRLACWHRTITQGSPINALAVSSSPAQAGFLSACTSECYPETYGWPWVFPRALSAVLPAQFCPPSYDWNYFEFDGKQGSFAEKWQRECLNAAFVMQHLTSIWLYIYPYYYYTHTYI